ncbi:helix-turn-helix domain-containing protein [Pantoea stewartii]|uniref:Gp48 n=1 Tax=Pantoea stewartii subsp. stewartii DC283 TaxID=660596 RepID=H3RLJ5_PANSE|nr:helix-turn-helix transcriptional regulator [Pantoea stewartii]ARF52754.1 transcriptional regulator [Pantoea stewartii subsp. stewartii DC283]EHT97708.1 Gp48 [Pantoea stewartii subsp. stewartii DC283]KAB0554012.1 helix-turn-helix transcriptional regulator [Pantoea stewartii subsp. stewartii]
MKPVSVSELKQDMLSSPESVEAYEDADRELAVLEALHSMREHAKITKAELARRLNIQPSAITNLEKNPLGASLKTLNRYAKACGATFDFSIVYK